MKFGGEYRYYQLNVRNLCAPNGQFSYTGGETGNDFADFLASVLPMRRISPALP
jgi:hypothetical protein